MWHSRLSVAMIAAAGFFLIAGGLFVAAQLIPYVDVGFVVPLGLEILAGVFAATGALTLVVSFVFRKLRHR